MPSLSPASTDLSLASTTSVLTCPDGGPVVVISCLSMTWIKEETMLVHPVAVPGSGTRSWTVLGDDDVPVAPVDRFLAYLTEIGRSPNTVKAYAHDMKDLWQFLGFRGLDWREARLEDIAEFVVWLQLPAAGRAGEVAVLPSSVPEVSVM